jgi:hypothetical protein
MKTRTIFPLLVFVILLTLVSICASKAFAEEQDQPDPTPTPEPEVTIVNVQVNTPGDVDASIDINADGDTQVSINGQIPFQSYYYSSITYYDDSALKTSIASIQTLIAGMSNMTIQNISDIDTLAASIVRLIQEQGVTQDNVVILHSTLLELENQVLSLQESLITSNTQNQANLTALQNLVGRAILQLAEYFQEQLCQAQIHLQTVQEDLQAQILALQEQNQQKMNQMSLLQNQETNNLRNDYQRNMMAGVSGLSLAILGSGALLYIRTRKVSN